MAVVSPHNPRVSALLQPLAEPPDWLAAVADPDRVRGALERVMPGICECQVVRIRIKNEGCIARYRITRVQAGQPSAIEVEGEVVPPQHRRDGSGSGSWLPELGLRLSGDEADTGLPALEELLDASLAGRLITAALGAASGPYPGYAVRGCVPHVMRYKPGSRCTVVYDLDLPEGSPRAWPRSVVGKTYYGDKGEVAWTAMRGLWDSPLRRAGAVAEPLAYLADQRVLLQRVIPHSWTLKQLLRRALHDGTEARAVEAGLERAAHGLAAIHASGVATSQTRSLADERDEVQEVLGRLADCEPSLEDSAASLLDELGMTGVGAVDQPMVPSHGSFRPAQAVLGSGGRIGFIDFDSFCRAEPAMDVALFCSALADTGLRSLAGAGALDAAGHLQRLEALCDRFLAAYERSAPLDRGRVRLWWQLYALTGVLHCWTKAKFDRLDYRMALAQHALRPPEILR